MKICFVTTGDIVTLATIKRATGMANPLINSGYKVAIVAENNPNNLERFKLECPNATILLFEKQSAKQELKQKKQLIKEWQPDIVYVCALGFRNWIHKYNVAAKSIYLVEHSELPSAIPGNKKRYVYRLLETLSTIVFDGQIFASRYLEQAFSKGIKHFFTKRQPTLYSPYAYNKDLLLNYNQEQYKQLQEQYKGKKIILYMGTLALNYGFLDIIKAAQILAEKKDDFVVLVMGRGRHAEIGKKYLEDNNFEQKVIMLGYVPENDIPAYFKLADVFVSPLYNTIQDKARCPSKLFMYLPFKKPVITCKIGEAQELFKDQGYYYAPGNIEELSTLMENTILKNTEENIMDIDRYSWDYRTEEFDKWIKSNYKINKQ